MGKPLKIKEDRSPAELRRLVRRERDGRVAARLYAVANALGGMSRAEAAQLAGMERQALRDAVLRYNGEDLAGLRDEPSCGDSTWTCPYLNLAATIERNWDRPRSPEDQNERYHRMTADLIHS